MQMTPLSPLIQDTQFLGVIHILPSLFSVWFTEIIYFVLLIPPPQQNPSIEKPNHKASSVITTPAACVRFLTTRCLIFQ